MHTDKWLCHQTNLDLADRGHQSSCRLAFVDADTFDALLARIRLLQEGPIALRSNGLNVKSELALLPPLPTWPSLLVLLVVSNSRTVHISGDQCWGTKAQITKLCRLISDRR